MFRESPPEDSLLSQEDKPVLPIRYPSTRQFCPRRTPSLRQTASLLVAVASLFMLPACCQGQYQTLYSFGATATDGFNPHYCQLIQASDGNIYGAASNGGAYGGGTVFGFSPASLDGPLGTLGYFTLLSFSYGTTNVAGPGAGVIQGSDLRLYGTCDNASTQGGGAFGLTLGGVCTVLSPNFSTNFGLPYSPEYGLMQASDGNLYGTTTQGGINQEGALYRINPLTGQLATLWSFGNDGNGYGPNCNLIQASDSNLYGTTTWGGQNGNSSSGTVFRYNLTTGMLTALHSFSGADGAAPYAGLVQGSDGYLYGTTSGGGTINGDPAAGSGVVFKMSLDGTFYQQIYSFSQHDGNGYSPIDPLIQAPNGNLYGTLYSGGANNVGTLFQLTPVGVFTKLVDFNFGIARNPWGGVLLASDGWLYGVSEAGGATDQGTIYRYGPVINPNAPTAITLPNYSLTIGTAATLTANLTRTDTGADLSGETVTFTVDGSPIGSAATASNGNATLSWTPPPALGAGSHVLGAQFVGAPGFLAFSTTSSLTLTQVPTALALPNYTLAIGTPATLIATLTRTDTGAMVSGESIVFTVNGSQIGAAVTDVNGNAALSWTPPASLAAGTLALAARFAGDTTFEPSATASTGTLKKGALTLTVSSVTGSLGATVPLTATLTNAAGVGIANATITLSLGCFDVKTVQTNSSGVARINYTIPECECPGTYTVNAKFAGNGSYLGATGSGTLTVTRCAVAVTVQSVTGRAGTRVTLQATLTDSSGQPLSCEPLQFSVGGIDCGIYVETGCDGTAQISYDIPTRTAAGSYLIGVTFNGGPFFQSGSGSSTLTVTH